MSGAESKIELMAVVVASDIKVKMVLPRMRYSGKLGMSNLKNAENTAASTHIMSSGLSTDQATPSMLRRYFSLKSLDTNEVIVNQLRRRAFFFASLSAMKTPIWKEGAVFPRSVKSNAYCIVGSASACLFMKLAAVGMG